MSCRLRVENESLLDAISLDIFPREAAFSVNKLGTWVRVSSATSCDGTAEGQICELLEDGSVKVLGVGHINIRKFC